MSRSDARQSSAHLLLLLVEGHLAAPAAGGVRLHVHLAETLRALGHLREVEDEERVEGGRKVWE